VLTPRFAGPQRSERLGLIYKLAVLAYIFAVVIFSYREGLTIVAKLAGGILVAMFVFRAVFKSEGFFFPREYILLFAWTMIGIVSSLLSNAPDTALSRVITLAQVYPLAFVVSNLIVWNGDTRFYWGSLIVAAVVSGVATLANPAEFTGGDGRIAGTLGNANAFAALLAFGVALCAAGFIGFRSMIVKAACIAAGVFFVYLVGRTGSRMGMLASVFAVLSAAVCFQLSRKGRGAWRNIWVLVVGVVVVVGSAAYLLSSEFAERLLALQVTAESQDFSASGDMSLYNRWLLYQKALELALGDPFLGVGLDVFRTAGLEFRTIGNNSHSNYMEVLASTGFIGAICYFAIYQRWWSMLISSRAALSNPALVFAFTASIGIAVVMLVLDVAMVTYYEKLTWLGMAGLIAEVNLLMRGARPQSRFGLGVRS
jgi:O-antigen ligase